MRARPLGWIGASFLLGLLVCVLAVRVAGHYGGVRAELGDVKRTRLLPETKQRLATLTDKVYVTYYVTERSRMPSHLRRIEREVTDLLDALKRGSNGKLEFQVVDPTDDPDLQAFASRRKVAPLRARHVARDAWTEQEVWSTITLEYGPRNTAIVNGINADMLPRLQRILVEHLDQLERPRRPVFAFAAPDGFARLREQLAGMGEVIDVAPESFAPGDGFPEAADLLFWIEPRAAGPAQLRALQRFLAAGRSVVVAGSALTGDVVPAAAPAGPALVVERSDVDVEGLVEGFGLRPIGGLVLDSVSAPLRLDGPAGPEHAAPFRITSNALNMDFQEASADLSGTVLFVLPAPFALDGEALRDAGYRADLWITTSDDTWVRDDVPGKLPLDGLADRTKGTPAPKLPLLVWLRHADPWRGSLVACAASSPFHDDLIGADGTAHERLVKVLVDTLASNERLVIGRAGILPTEPLPPLGAGSRAAWRLASVFLLPVLLAGIALRQTRRAEGAAGGARTADRKRANARLRLAGTVALGVVLAGAASRIVRSGPALDATAARTNTLAGVTRDLARESTGDAAVRAELFLSADERLPADLRGAARRVTDLLHAIRGAGAELSIERVFPEDLDDAGRARLAEEGIRPVRVTSQDEAATTVRTVYFTLRLAAHGGASTVLPFAEAGASDNVEFRLAFALWRLRTGRQVTVAFASDVPRMSGGEAHELYQSRGLIAPKGQDVYSIARRLVALHDFHVVHVNPREPDLAGTTPGPDASGAPDALVWLQPRRSVKRMLERTVDYLYRGGRVFLAAQHFSMQSRQYPGTGFEFVYWPQPQSPDVEEFYFPDIGIRMVREVLFDAASFPIELESQVHAAARRQFRRMELAKPFVIRGLAANFDRESPITRWLGDLPLLFANHFDVDVERLAAAGLAARTLITTSPATWTFDWKGGFLPDEVLAGPPVDDAGVPATKGRLPVMLDVRGQFPWPEKGFVFPGQRLNADGTLMEVEGPEEFTLPEPVEDAAPGRLVFLAESEMFKDRWLQELKDRFRADHLLLNAVASLALDDSSHGPHGPELAALMARRPVVRGFDPVQPEAQLFWRAAVLGAAPLLVLLLGVARTSWSRWTRP